MVLAKKLEFLGKDLVVIPALLRHILYGLILSSFLIQMLDFVSFLASTEI